MRYEVPTDRRSFNRVVKRQRGLFTAEQARGAGFDVHRFRSWVVRGDWDCVRASVYRRSGSPVTFRDRVYAEILTRRGRAVACGRTALHLWGLAPEPDVIELAGQSSFRGAQVVMYDLTLASHERTVLDGVPLTAPIRSILDGACDMPTAQLERVIGDARVRGLVDPFRLDAAAARIRGPRRRGAARVRAVLRDGPLRDSELEQRFLELVRRAGLPEPVRQYLVHGICSPFDFAWPPPMVLVEVDGTQQHASPEQQRRDARKQSRAVAAGFRVLRFTWEDVIERAEETIAVLRSVLDADQLA